MKRKEETIEQLETRLAKMKKKKELEYWTNSLSTADNSALCYLIAEGEGQSIFTLWKECQRSCDCKGFEKLLKERIAENKRIYEVHANARTLSEQNIWRLQNE